MPWSPLLKRLGATIAAGALVGVGLALPGTPASAAIAVNEPVLYWNSVLLTAFRDAVKPAPGPLSRSGAMMHLAVYDAINAITRTGKPYRYVNGAARRDASVPLAAAYAAYGVLKKEFPTQSFDAALNAVKAEAGADVAGAQTIGEGAAQAITQAREGDGSTAPATYNVSSEPGQWRPTGGPCDRAVTPQWGEVAPFAMASDEQFRPPLPGGFSSTSALLASSLYRDQLQEVRDFGGATSAKRTAEQTEIAHFWANDVDETYLPPGQLFDHTASVARAKELSVPQQARLFALVGVGMADAAIASWDAKYDTTIDLWRPESGIKAALDPNWQPLLFNAQTGTHFSPCFPAYVSGHATFAGAWAAVMRNYFGTDNVTFSAGTQDPKATVRTRTYTSFSAAAKENALSRIYLGVHYRLDADYGLSAGTSVGDWAYRNILTPDVCQAPGTTCGSPGYSTTTQAGKAFAAGATTLALTGDDAVQQVSLPFPVKFYGQTYNSVWVDTNGQVYFTNPNGPHPDECGPIPNAAVPNGVLAVYCRDLIVDANAKVRVATLGAAPNRQYVIEWNNPYFFGNTSKRINASVTFNEANTDITYNYTGIDNADERGAAGVLVGLENPAGTAATQYSWSQPALQNNLAITFRAR